MSKIIRVNRDSVCVGKDDGSFIEVKKSELNFTPTVGDAVEIFTAGDSVIVSKAKLASSSSDFAENIVNVSEKSEMGPTVNQVAYALLAIFLGSFGIHKFYAGKVVMGIIYILLSWTFIPGVIGFIEGIVALTKRADKRGNIVV
jgi:TM2 domain-containing membrane protein YozV